ncbi:MAG: glycosyltransferase [Patescibacteria group bacterium]
MSAHPLSKITIGIPAYNEAANIKHLLLALLKQNTTGFILHEIIVISDGSTDDTVKIARSITNSRIHVFEFTQREGQQKRQNQILAQYTGDIIVFIEADTLPASVDTLKHLVEPLLILHSDDKLMMTIGNPYYLTPRNFF